MDSDFFSIYVVIGIFTGAAVIDNNRECHIFSIPEVKAYEASKLRTRGDVLNTKICYIRQKSNAFKVNSRKR